MKEKYVITKNNESNELIIRQYEELYDKEELLLLSEQKYDEETIKSSIGKNKSFLISILRSNNMFPPALYADKIAEAVISIYDSGYNRPVELHFDDLELLTKEEKNTENTENIEKEDAGIDELLEESFDIDYDDKDKIKSNNSLVVPDDEPFDIEE